ncbi:hydrogenase 4 subunit B [Sansalvadorimonas verongulae]|uniref:hydrogenase 4 subunit B n=1 Tax=Sansalvadorimonas verongulae TaxID=2172824 RepID=UPI0012BC240E|nr:hydrogenase 4 subunit B [Sansalvadorimonas verongulae]MTI14546.1 hydrogenase 4 subunit B [Sansalvadorimonas verongulae]
MTALSVSILLYIAGALASLALNKAENTAIKLSGILGALGGVAGLFASVPTLLNGTTVVKQIYSPFYFADFMIRLDPLAAFMVMVISVLVVAASIYSISYMEEYKGKGAWAMGFFMNTFIASMVALVVSDNAFYFIVFFEMMSLASYFLVIAEQDKKAVDAGLQYFLIAHAGSVLILIAFYMMYRATGSMNFASFETLRDTAHALPVWESSVIFLLAFFGFGAKAGMIALHGWLPKAHPAAPSNGSALMSGVMVKIGVFGIIKVGIVFLGAQVLWWGFVVLAFGCVSSVLGVLYALAEHDIKRLLAYHTVENVGIILMGVGVGMIGMTTGHPVIAALGLLGGLYHLLNHAVFKGLLFLGAGSIIFRTHTKDMEKMGGLAKVMPYTALAFLIGTMAISALPPLNGFVSEWFIYQSLLSLSHGSSMAVQVGGPVAIIMLAITGALACMCFVKVFGVSFCGAPRTENAANAKEVPAPMVMGAWILAILCVVLGLGSPWIAPVISSVATSVISMDTVNVVQGAALIPADGTRAILSTPIIIIALSALILVPVLLVSVFRGPALKRRTKRDLPWACGYGYEGRMTVSAGGFTQALRSMFAPLYTLRKILDPAPAMNAVLTATTNAARKTEPVFDDYIIMPVSRLIIRLADKIKVMQHGDFRIYCLYMVIALLVLLFVPVEFGGM